MSVGGYNQSAIGSLNPIFGVQPSGGGPAESFAVDFVDGDLVGGVLTINHGLNSPRVVVVIADDTNAQIVPDDVSFIDADNVDVDLSSFQPLPNVWHAFIVGV